MIIKPIICEKCNLELQPEYIKVGLDHGELIRICGLCGNVIKIEVKEDE